MRHCSLDDIKVSAPASAPLAEAFGVGGGETFVRMGTNGRLREELSLEHSVVHECPPVAQPRQDFAGRLLTGDLW